MVVCLPERFLSLQSSGKKTKPNSDNYSSGAYTNKYGLQIDKLLADSKSVNAVPVYVFFTASTTPKKSQCGGRTRSTGPHSVGAQTIYDQFIANGKSKVSGCNRGDAIGDTQCPNSNHFCCKPQLLRIRDKMGVPNFSYCHFKHAGFVVASEYHDPYVEFAVWNDGTVIWRDNPNRHDSNLLTANVDPKAVDKLFEKLSASRLLDPDLRWQQLGPDSGYGAIRDTQCPSPQPLSLHDAAIEVHDKMGVPYFEVDTI